MRSIRRKTPELIKRPFQPRYSIVENPRQIPQLIIGILNGQAFAKALGRDLFRSAGHAVQRRQSRTRQAITSETCDGERNRQTQQKDREQFSKFMPERLLTAGEANQSGTSSH